MTEFFLYYGLAVTIVGILVTLYAIKIFQKEHKRWMKLKGTMRYFVLAALSFTTAGMFLGISYMDTSNHIVLRSAPQLFYVLGFVFLLLGGRNFRKFSDTLHSEKNNINKDSGEN